MPQYTNWAHLKSPYFSLLDAEIVLCQLKLGKNSHSYEAYGDPIEDLMSHPRR
jgi:hypothetical protein